MSDKLLSKQDILSNEDRKFEDIHVPEWGGMVRIATISGEARDRFEASIVAKNGQMNTENIRAKLVAACVVDESNKLLFSENDIKQLGSKSCVALDRIFSAAQKLNGIGQTELDQLAKN